jgi:hypothetical protein
MHHSLLFIILVGSKTKEGAGNITGTGSSHRNRIVILEGFDCCIRRSGLLQNKGFLSFNCEDKLEGSMWFLVVVVAIIIYLIVAFVCYGECVDETKDRGARRALTGERHVPVAVSISLMCLIVALVLVIVIFCHHDCCMLAALLCIKQSYCGCVSAGWWIYC